MHCCTVFIALLLWAGTALGLPKVDWMISDDFDDQTIIDSMGGEKIGKHVYYIDNQKKVSWMTAWQLCRKQNMYLATAGDADDLKAISDALNKKGCAGEKFWVAGNDFATTDSFVWWPSVKAVTDDLFTTGNSENKHALQMVRRESEESFVLQNDDANAETHFICQLNPKKIQLRVI